MSTTFSAYAIIGVRVPASKLFHPPTKVRAFPHNHPEDWKHDPKTGRPLWVTETLPIEDFDEEESTFADYYRVLHCNDEYYIAMVMHDDYTSSNCGETDLLVRLDIDNFKADYLAFKACLEKAGIWDENSFGLWAILTGG